MNLFNEIKPSNKHNYYLSNVQLQLNDSNVEGLIYALNNLCKYSYKRLKQINCHNPKNLEKRIFKTVNKIVVPRYEQKPKLKELIVLDNENQFISLDDSVYCEDIEEYVHQDSDHYFCEDCDKTYFNSNNFITVGDGYVCEECKSNYNSCDGCDTWLVDDDTINTDRHTYCESCYSDNTFHCENCEATFDNNESCNCEEEENQIIYSYHRKKVDLLNLKIDYEENPITYGIEIETDIRKHEENLSATAIGQKVLELFNNNEIILMEDGSIGGFEIVSTNASFNYHKQYFWNRFFDSNIREYLKSYHSSNCGIHIHCSKKHFTEQEQAKIVCFVNSEYNNNFIVQIASRSTVYSSSYKKDKTLDNYYSSNRFEPINLTNPNTVEYRIFKGNLKENSFFRYLEFVDSLNLYIKSLSDKKNNVQYYVSSLKYENYLNFLYSNFEKKHYSNLFSWLKIKGYEEYHNKIVFINNNKFSFRRRFKSLCA